MNSLVLAITGIFFFGLAYKYYATFIAKKIYAIYSFTGTAPSIEFEDGLDFVPAKKEILFGHHFTSIAGAAPIIGPCIAAFWGWLPAFIWILFGTVFIGAIHDFGALVVSIREKGKTIADITGIVINKRIRTMFLIFVMMLCWLVLSVFAMAIAGLFVSIPSAVIPINIEIIMALVLGYLFYIKKNDSIILSIIALILLYVFIFIGSKFPLSFGSLGLDQSSQINLWIILLFMYSSIASLLPVWILLQPRDYINSHQLIVGLGLIFFGIIIARPIVDAPMIRLDNLNAPNMLPLLFVTVACGAISGFHGLIASGTTSKQIKNISDSKVIGYGSMIGEGILALASLIAAVAGISLVTECKLPSVGWIEDLNWHIYYDNWANATTNKATAFVLGGGALIESIGLSSSLSKTLMAVLIISFAATTLDTATRIQRIIIMEIGDAIKLEVFKNKYIATVFSVFPALILTLWNIKDPSSGLELKAGWALWPVFGASNQMLAALTLMVIAIYFWKKNKNVLPLVLPFVFLVSITITSLLIHAFSFFENNRLLFFIVTILFLLTLWMLYEGWLVYYNDRSKIKVNK